jgi:hypothetical protein
MSNQITQKYRNIPLTRTEQILIDLVNTIESSFGDFNINIEQLDINTDELEGFAEESRDYLASIDSKIVAELKSNKWKLENEANDLVQTFNYADAGTADERVTSIVYSSVLLGLTVTETFAYAGGTGTYRVSTITLS